jgi:hypothetical protein
MLATGNEAERRFAFANTTECSAIASAFFISLPIRSLDRLALQRQLDATGGSTDANDNRPAAAE